MPRFFLGDFFGTALVGSGLQFYERAVKATTNLASSETADGSTLLLQEHDGQFFLKVGGVPLMSTTQSSSEQTMAELACADMANGGRVLIGGLGFGFTLRRVLELVDARAEVVVAELLPIIAAWNREFLQSVNGALLDEERVTLAIRDVYELIAAEKKGFDAILLDVDNSPDPLVDEGNGRLYDEKGLLLVKKALRSGGRVVYWSAKRDDRFARLLRKHFFQVEIIPAKAYPKAKRFTHTLFVAEK